MMNQTSTTDTARGRLPVEVALDSVRPIFHALLAQFTQATEEHGRHRVMFVSPEQGDGTTTLATCTALMLVRHFRRDVALLEANLYHPAMANYLGMVPGPGLLDVVGGSTDQIDAVRPSSVEGLHVLTAGGRHRPDAGALAGEPLQSMIARISREHPYTIIDAPPVLEHPDTCLLLEHVDEVLLVVRAGSTQTRRAKVAVQIIENAGVKVGGVLLNRFKPHLPLGIGEHLVA
jgi:Mrp family chromosome partitioning ATPase